MNIKQKKILEEKIEYINGLNLEAIADGASYNSAKLTYRVYKKNGERRACIPKWTYNLYEFYSLVESAAIELENFIRDGSNLFDIDSLDEDTILQIELVYNHVTGNHKL